jgi:hypothetical protein
MTDAFSPRLDVLPPPQRRLWRELGAAPAPFALYGGTALALYLGHRQSVDFDFFSETSFDPAALARSLPFAAGASVAQQAPNTLILIVDRDAPISVAFYGLPHLRRIHRPIPVGSEGVRIASLIDLAGTKAELVQRRAEAKDYLDLDALIADGRVGLPLALAAARAIHGPSFNAQATLKALSYFGDGTLPSLPRPVRDRLAAAARSVDLDRLPSIPVAAGA